MAEIQDDDIGGEIGEIEAVEKQDQTPPPAPEVEVPEFYRGKSIQDVVKMHQEAQKVIGRQGNEVAEVRRLADELIKSQLVPKQKVDEPKPVDFFENPQEAIRQQIDNHPKLLEAERYAKQVQAEQAKMRLNQLHPDLTQIVQDQGFREWVGASKVRQQLFQQADAYDVDAAHELLSTYKELKAVRQQKTEAVDNSARDRALSAAAVDTGGSGEMTRKVYRRADLITLKMRDPRKYEAMGDEILRAYAEGRVK
jgi:hypothetical protein